MKWTYSFLAIIGFILPMSQFTPWALEHGLDIGRFFADLFSNRIGGFFGMDVFVAAVVTILLIQQEGKRLQVPNLLLPILGTLLVGVSFGLPLFLALRERALQMGMEIEKHHGVA